MDIVASGTAPPSGSVTRFRVYNVGGHMQGFPLSGLVQGETAGKTARLDTLDLAVGPIQLGAHGTVGESVMADFDLLVTDMAVLGPQYGGRLALNGRAAGPKQSIAIEAQATGERLRQDKNTIERFSLRANANTDRTLPFDATLALFGVAADTSRVDSVRVQLAGTVSSHRATLAAQGLQGSLALLLTGGLVDSTWTGHIDSLAFMHPRSGAWRQVTPAGLTAGRTGGDLDSLLLQSESALLRLSGSWERSGAWQGAMRLNGFGLERVPMKLPENMSLVGVLEARADLKGEGKRTLGTADLSVLACTLMVRGPEPATFTFGDLELGGTIAESSLD
ncbi:MAG TPA: hypothetical protein VFP10_11815, partial [Candidatus Eisenbacteria bacterium]|nr:hypothetical protein [Candidatus Eisenbacteria bacterium]